MYPAHNEPENIMLVFIAACERNQQLKHCKHSAALTESTAAEMQCSGEQIDTCKLTLLAASTIACCI